MVRSLDGDHSRIRQVIVRLTADCRVSRPQLLAAIHPADEGPFAAAMETRRSRYNLPDGEAREAKASAVDYTVTREALDHRDCDTGEGRFQRVATSDDAEGKASRGFWGSSIEQATALRRATRVRCSSQQLRCARRPRMMTVTSRSIRLGMHIAQYGRSAASGSRRLQHFSKTWADFGALERTDEET